MLKEAECRSSFRVINGGWKPPESEQLDDKWLGRLTAAIIESDFVNAVDIKDHKMVPESCFGINANLGCFVPELDAESEQLKCRGLEVRPAPLLTQKSDGTTCESRCDLLEYDARVDENAS